jgi:hypothetical protein
VNEITPQQLWGEKSCKSIPVLLSRTAQEKKLGLSLEDSPIVKEFQGRVLMFVDSVWLPITLR